jgi:hypothetical protein
MKRALGLVAVATALGLAASAAASAPTTVRGRSGPLSATIVPGPHNPKINTHWPLLVTATLNGKPAHATARYLYMLGYMVVATRNPFGKSPYRFTGHYKDTFVWPPDSLGQSLTLRVVVTAGGHTVNLDWAVTPVK